MAEPAMALMKSRRRTAAPKAQEHANTSQLHQGFATGEIGSGVKLHSSNREARMSLMGHSRPMQPVFLPAHVRFGLKATYIRRCREMTRSAGRRRPRPRRCSTPISSRDEFVADQ
jgi:hypothetical protein